jgi:hypothetical protein
VARRLAPALAVFAGAALIFLAEPLAAKLVLPRLGGGPSVWTGCMLFFQALLLAGYGYAHLLGTRSSRRVQVVVHAVVLAAGLAVLPIALPRGLGDPGGWPPLAWLAAALGGALALPFAALAGTGLLLQRWYEGDDPYPLYAASNLGSLAALLAYPVLVEPALPVMTQAKAWTWLYVATATLAVAYGATAHRKTTSPPPSAPRIAWSRRLRWLVLAFVPSSLVLGATQHMTTDVTSVPFLWVVPLAAYLGSFVVAFSRRRLVSPRAWQIVFAVTAVAAATSMWALARAYAATLLVLHPVLVFAAGCACHGRLADLRPAPARLTEFYLWIAVGGLLGGVFNAVIAPAIFPVLLEYPLMIVAAAFLLSEGDPKRSWRLDLLSAAAILVFAIAAQRYAERMDWSQRNQVLFVQAVLPCAAVLFLVGRPRRFAMALAALIAVGGFWGGIRGETLVRSRTFYGVHRVVERSGPTLAAEGDDGASRPVSVRFRILYNGTTRHGSQALDPTLRNLPTSYYHRSGIVGRLFDVLGARFERIGVIGLGAGTLAAYAHETQSMTFYELDPEVVRIARDPSLFTYVSHSKARMDFVTGDGRLGIAKAPPGHFDLIVVDAFSSDAIPVHLLTKEAMALYLRALSPEGVLLLNLTNNHVDLLPIVDALAADAHLNGIVGEDAPQTFQQMLEGMDGARWAILGRDTAALGPLADDDTRLKLPVNPSRAPDRRYLWTDDYASVFTVLTPR